MSFGRPPETPEEAEKAKSADTVISASIDTLHMFFPTCEITVLVRHPDKPDQKLLGTTDDIREVLKVFQDAAADWKNSRLSDCEGGKQ